MDSNKSKRVVVYCRVATQAQLDGDHTLEAQSARLHEQAERLGYEIVGKVSEYEKGTSLDRDGWKRACQKAVEQKADILLVADLTRIARDPILWMQALRELSGKGVWIQSAAEPDAFRVDPLFHLVRRTTDDVTYYDATPQAKHYKKLELLKVLEPAIKAASEGITTAAFEFAQKELL